MKIIIATMPRTASKNVMANMHLYLLARFQQSHALYNAAGNLILPVVGLDEFLNAGHSRLFKTKAKLIDGKIVITNEIIIDKMSELLIRVEMLRSLTPHWAIKYFPLQTGSELTDNIFSLADNIFYLTREDIFDHSLSLSISTMTSSWFPGNFQQKVIKYLLTQPISVDINLFRNNIRRFLQYNNEVCKNKSVIKFEDLIKIRNSKEFCSLFNLEYYHFDFIEPKIEYGDNKISMINNIEELKLIYKEELDINTQLRA